MNNINIFFADNKKIVNDYAYKYISNLDIPEILKESIIYSLVNDGKKIRPISFLGMLNNYNMDYRNYLDVALAIELIHTYSLVHDDLPAMDNDDYRWGKFTNHKKFGEDIAVLTGDAMQTLAYELITSNSFLNDNIKLKLINVLANYSGVNGMIAGQIYDVKQKLYEVDKEYLKKMHNLKTGKLIALPLIFASYIAEDTENISDVINFGEEVGLAYQIKDDILDYYGEFSTIGKMPSDYEMITYLSFYGIDECERLLKEHTENAKSIAKKLNNNFLNEYAELLLIRKK